MLPSVVIPGLSSFAAECSIILDILLLGKWGLSEYNISFWDACDSSGAQREGVAKWFCAISEYASLTLLIACNFTEETIAMYHVVAGSQETTGFLLHSIPKGLFLFRLMKAEWNAGSKNSRYSYGSLSQFSFSPLATLVPSTSYCKLTSEAMPAFRQASFCHSLNFIGP